MILKKILPIPLIGPFSDPNEIDRHYAQAKPTRYCLAWAAIVGARLLHSADEAGGLVAPTEQDLQETQEDYRNDKKNNLLFSPDCFKRIGLSQSSFSKQVSTNGTWVKTQINQAVQTLLPRLEENLLYLGFMSGMGESDNRCHAFGVLSRQGRHFCIDEALSSGIVETKQQDLRSLLVSVLTNYSRIDPFSRFCFLALAR